MGHPHSKEETEDRMPGSPGARALSAMAVAAQRAREGILPTPTPARPERHARPPGGAAAATPAAPPKPLPTPSPTTVPRRVSSWSSRAGSSPPSPSPAPTSSPDLEGLLRHSQEHLLPEADPVPARPPTRPEVGGANPPPLVTLPAWWADPERREQVLMRAVAVVAALVVAFAVTLAIVKGVQSRSTPASPPAPRVTPTTTAHHAAASSAGRPHRDGASSTKAGSSTTLPASTPGAAPIISAVSPTSGSAGASLTVSGANFMSANGTITASFGGQPASIDCPQQSTCTITVPTLSSPQNPVPLTITTESGTSNTVDFTYG